MRTLLIPLTGGPSLLISCITRRPLSRASRSRSIVTPGQYRSTRYVGTPVLLSHGRYRRPGIPESPKPVIFPARDEHLLYLHLVFTGFRMCYTRLGGKELGTG